LKIPPQDAHSLSETTEALFGNEKIIARTLQCFSRLKERLDGCIDNTEPAIHVIEPMWGELVKLRKRNIQMRLVTEITPENLVYCKKLMEIAEIRHLDGVRSNFGVGDGKEYLGHTISQQDKPLSHAILSNVRGIVEAQQYLFEVLWSKAIPSEVKIREIEQGVDRQFIETIHEPRRIQKVGFDLAKSATNEIMILFSTSNAFRRQMEYAGAADLLRELAIKKGVRVRILTPVDETIEHTVQKLREVQQDEPALQKKIDIEIRYVQSHQQTKVTILLIDKKFSLAVELKDDTKDTSDDAIGLATYSNSRSTVLSYASIFESLWNQTELYRQIKEANIKLNLLNNSQKEFINTAAHELRSPIQPILGLSEILNSKLKDSEERELINVIHRNAKRLQMLTEDILDVTRIESRSLQLNKEHFNLKDIIVNCIDEVRANRYSNNYSSNRKNLPKIQVEHKDVFIDADKGRIFQVISNLLTNAIKFTDSEGRISISSETKDGNVVTTIKDTGIGIDPEIMAKLFTKFATKSYGGSGLGLYISKSIVEAHNGKIWAHDNLNEKGAVFSFSLPLSSQ
jgi:two-component system, OmpR family, sensor histidine kinase VicK